MFPPAVAAELPVGLALTRLVVCLESGLPWSEAERVGRLAENPHTVPVVDHEGALLGVLPSTEIRPGAGSPSHGIGSVADHAASAVSVHESESLGKAFETMGKHRVREIVVVGDALLVVGVLRDVDALRFVSRVAHGGTRPALGCPDGN